MAGKARKGTSGGREEGPLRHRMPPRGSRRLAAGDYAQECLARLARILVRTGHSPERLWREFRDICYGFKEPARRFEPEQLSHITDVPHVIALWHTDPDYLDAHGLPIPLPLRSKGRSLYTLIERVLPGEKPAAVVESLERMRGIRRRGTLYLPTDRYCIYPEDSARLHSLSTLLGMLRTVDHNVSHRGSSRLFERVARNPSFPVRALPAFNRQLNTLALELLRKLDGEMQLYERSATAGPRTRLGVGIFAFENPVLGSTRLGRRTPPKRSSSRHRKGRNRR
jgi:Family of unknown function (DUF6502)